MPVYIEVVKAKSDAPVKGAVVTLVYPDGTRDETTTAETGLAVFERSGLADIHINGQLSQSNFDLAEGETVTIALQGDKVKLPKRLKLARLHGLNSNPILPAHQPAQRQVLLHVQAPLGRLNKQGPRLNLSLVIDYSTSMMGENSIVATEATAYILEQVQGNERAAIITFNQTTRTLQPARQLNDQARQVLVEQLQQPALAGGSNLWAGWLAGVEQSLAHQEADSQHWVVLITDGRPDAGPTDLESLSAKAAELKQQGVITHTIAIGAEANQSLLQAIAAAGGGEFDMLAGLESRPHGLQQRFKMVHPSLLVGHNAVINLTAPLAGVQVTPLGAAPYARLPHGLQITLGELLSAQSRQLPLQVNLPPYPPGQQVCLSATLNYLDGTTMLPVTIPALPICFTVVAAETKEEAPQQQPQPSASTAVWKNPVWAILSGGVLFLLLALVGVGTLLMISPSTPTQPETGVDTTAGEPVKVAEVIPVAVVVSPHGFLIKTHIG